MSHQAYFSLSPAPADPLTALHNTAPGPGAPQGAVTSLFTPQAQGGPTVESPGPTGQDAIANMLVWGERGLKTVL